MAVRKAKPPQSSPVFEKIHRDRLKRCVETAQSAQRTIEKSKELTEEARELVDRIHRLRDEDRR